MLQQYLLLLGLGEAHGVTWIAAVFPSYSYDQRRTNFRRDFPVYQLVVVGSYLLIDQG